MKIPIYQVDAFTGEVFRGNPAAVCLLENWLPDDMMQKIGMENNLAETAFIVPNGNSFDIRWFTPKIEIDLCGHATLASAHVLFNHLDFNKDHIQFNTEKHGELFVRKNNDLLTLEFPSSPPKKITLTDTIIRALGKEPVEIMESRDLMAVYESEEDILEFKPDFTALMQLDYLGVIVTAPGKKADFVSRFFAPNAGINEDPVTGSAHTSLIPWWSKKLRKTELHAFQLSERKGELFCEDAGDRVHISGKAVTYLVGEICL